MNNKRIIQSISMFVLGSVITTSAFVAHNAGVQAQDDSVKRGYVDVDGLDVYYEVHGDRDTEGTPLVLLHGALTTIEIAFGQFLPTLAADRQVIVIEQQGHGRTADRDQPLTYDQMALDTTAVLSELGVREADFFGYSMGGGIALEIAIRQPDLVRKLVLASVGFDVTGYHEESRQMIEFMTPDIFVGSGLPEMYESVAPNPDGWATLVSKVQELDLHFTGWPREEIQAIQAPTLIILGDSDDLRSESAVEMFQLLGGGVVGDLEGLPASQLAILPGTSHIGVMVERGDWVILMTTTFLDAPLPSNR